MIIIFLGAPGAGKGTQAEIASKKLAIPTVSMGNIMREALATGTQMGLKAKEFIESGKLVPDEVVIGIINERLADDDCKNGFILDGFPRTIPQAQALDKMGIKIDKVIDIDVPDKVIQDRMSGRRVSMSCGAPYHLAYNPPEVEGVCNSCSGKLIQRKDDLAETVINRLKVYHEQTEPLKDYYKSQGILSVINGQESVEDTTALVLGALED
ncbi:MAG: adenylate kinase [Oscillospiraceae bacterium]|jgi:adenylate kinase|nr:adenylate kinase [Oscillospiraceae bacterium]